MSTGKCTKLAPRFCGPFTILKHIGSSTYHLALPYGAKIHLVFHVSRLKELLGFCNNTVTIETLVTSEEVSSKPHVSERILNVKTKNLCPKIMREFKIKWMDKSIKDVTWEHENTLRNHFPNFPLQECNVLRGEDYYRHDHIISHGENVT